MNLADYKEVGESGHLGIVYLSSEKTGHRIVLKRTSIERGLREIKAYKKLPNSDLIEYRMENNGVLLMLSRHAGESLRDLVQSKDKQKRARLSQNLSKILESAQSSLREIHKCGLCHGRITPDKIIVSDDYRVNLVGYGDSRTKEEAFQIKAYDAYVAPEIVFSGDADIFLADYYSLGKSLQFALDDQVSDIALIDQISRLISIIPERRNLQ